jgi:hypothetical protein
MRHDPYTFRGVMSYFIAFLGSGIVFIWAHLYERGDFTIWKQKVWASSQNAFLAVVFFAFVQTMFFIDLLFKFKGGMLVLDLLAHLFFMGLFIGSAIMLFSYVEDPELTMSYLLSISCSIVICSSFLVLYFNHH